MHMRISFSRWLARGLISVPWIQDIGRGHSHQHRHDGAAWLVAHALSRLVDALQVAHALPLLLLTAYAAAAAAIFYAIEVPSPRGASCPGKRTGEAWGLWRWRRWRSP